MKKKKQTKKGVSLVPIDVSPSQLSVVEMGKAMQEEASRRKLITEYIKHHMKKGADYGGIHIGRNCLDKYNCTNKYHWSKDSLFKPGSEKFVSLFKLRPNFKRDVETVEMAGGTPGLFAYKCELVTSRGEVVGEGRGAAHLTEKDGWTVNNAIKIAEKRAQIDAVLRTGALSDFFTQDLEDMAPEPPVKPPPTKDQTETKDKNMLQSSINKINEAKDVDELLALDTRLANTKNERVRKELHALISARIDELQK